MTISVERYFDGCNAEIMLKLPQGDSYIIASKDYDDNKFAVSVYLPWLPLRGGLDAFGFKDEMHIEDLSKIVSAPVFKLIKIIREYLPVMKKGWIEDWMEEDYLCADPYKKFEPCEDKKDDSQLKFDF